MSLELHGHRSYPVSFPPWLPDASKIREHYRGTVLYWPYKVELTRWLSALLPTDGRCTLLDVGAGDGRLGIFLERYRPQTKVFGIETMIRPNPRALRDLAQFDGTLIPFGNKCFDVSLLCDVLHHTKTPEKLLREVKRVTRERIIIKDHFYENFFEKKLLYILDVLGNFRFGVNVAGNYFGKSGWDTLVSGVGATSVEIHSEVPLRKGLLKGLFHNGLEIIFVLNVNDRRTKPT